MRGRTPVAGATVVWRKLSDWPAGRIYGTPVRENAPVSVPTGPDGLCEVTWEIDSTQVDSQQRELAHRVGASLLAAPGEVEQPAVHFSASFRTAATTSYAPGDCTLLKDTETVQQALDKLCRNIGGAVEPETLKLANVLLGGNSTAIDLVDRKNNLILNGLEVPFDAFVRGISISVDSLIEAEPAPFDPIVEVALDLPYPTTDFDKLYWTSASQDPAEPDAPRIVAPFGFTQIRLDGQVAVNKKSLVWLPSDQVLAFINTMPFHLNGYAIRLGQDELKEAGWIGEPLPQRILCRLRVHSTHVWATVGGERRIYLNAEHLGTSVAASHDELLPDERDPQHAADLNLFSTSSRGSSPLRGSGEVGRAGCWRGDMVLSGAARLDRSPAPTGAGIQQSIQRTRDDSADCADWRTRAVGPQPAQRTAPDWADGCQGPLNPQVLGSNPRGRTRSTWNNAAGRSWRAGVGYASAQ